jgi:lipopolysaccharide O-acetyltransferase
MRVTKFTGIVREAFAADPFLWALWLFLCRILLEIKGLVLGFALHAPDLRLGRGSLVRGAKYISFGRDIRAKSGFWLEAVTHYGEQRFAPLIRIEDAVRFSDGVHISCIDRIVIKKNVLMGSHIYISDHNHGLYKGVENSLPSEPPAHRKLGGGGPVLIGENVLIGDNAIIVGPVTIGDGAIIGANSVVREDVQPGAMVAGIPARLIRRFNPATHTWERA